MICAIKTRFSCLRWRPTQRVFFLSLIALTDMQYWFLLKSTSAGLWGFEWWSSLHLWRVAWVDETAYLWEKVTKRQEGNEPSRSKTPFWNKSQVVQNVKEMRTFNRWTFKRLGYFVPSFCYLGVLRNKNTHKLEVYFCTIWWIKVEIVCVYFCQPGCVCVFYRD